MTENAIRKTNANSWAAILVTHHEDDGGLPNGHRTFKLVEEFNGVGSKKAAIKRAGTNKVLA